MREEFELWLSKAFDDLKFAVLGLNNEFYSQVCFLSHQVIEKSLKAFLLAKGRIYPKTHNLLELADLCFEINRELKNYENELRIVDGYYIPMRYPDIAFGSLPGSSPSRANAEEALKIAENIYRFTNEYTEGKL